MNYAGIKNLDVADGLGIRVSLFVSGCRNHCKGCFNEITWDFNYGAPFTKEVEDEVMKMLEHEHVSGLSVLGGEPFEEENQEVLAPFLERVRKTFPEKNIWAWSGYLLDKDLLAENGRKHTEYTQRILDCLEYLVDGRFVEEKRNLTLQFRGSENQRIWRKIDGEWKVISEQA
ncbi:MAG: anaerobic ribonucleoside-triphosphate reductase activating protein [Treponema sp.]|jgi:anaerobic ribonucleoside-triphosphate reductase activating protein|nr:anaerobic ribonucleoside-triphosphate reductase activating protein [Treponema sp.]MCR5125517.1 anaerobic ribonucleoside-triphosphate reductase activating protein [Treponema sp.]